MSSSPQDLPPSTETGVKPYITFIILVAGVIGGLVIVISVILICKYCVKRKRVLRRRHVVERERPTDNRFKPLLRYDSLESGAADRTSISLDLTITTPQGIQIDDYDDENDEDKEALLEYYPSPPHSARVELPEEGVEGASRGESHGSTSPPGAVGGTNNTGRYTESECQYIQRGRRDRGSADRFPRQLSLGAHVPETIPLTSSRSPRASDPEFGAELRMRLEMEQERIEIERAREQEEAEEEDKEMEALAAAEATIEDLAEGLPSPHMLEDSPSPIIKPRTTQVAAEIHHHPRLSDGDKNNSRQCAHPGAVESSGGEVSSSRTYMPPRELRIRPADMRGHSHSMEIVSPEKTRFHRKARRIKSYDDVADYDVLRITEFTKGPFYNADYDAMSEGSAGSISKVRYYDTGSIEQLDEEHLRFYTEFEGAIGGAVEESDDTETLNGTRKYKELWELRAALEEDECSDTIRLEDGSSIEMSPDCENLASCTTSFESNTEPGPYLADSDLGTTDNCKRRGSHQGSEIGCSNLLHPNYENRRQSYKNILTKRLQKLDAPTTSAENSFDSVETMDTDGEVSDTSRYEVTTTSFESTTDNTDSNNEGQNNKLKQMRGDSGYKSLETQSTLKGTETKKRGSVSFDCSDTFDHEMIPFDIVKLKDVSPPAASPFEFDRVKYRRRSSQTCHFERRGAKTASKKRREYSRERQAVQVYESIMEPETDSKSDQPSGDSFEEGNAPSKISVFSRFFKSQSKVPRSVRYVQRDYSIDQKTNELFNEFVRIDPIYETRRSPRLHQRPRLQRKNTEPAYLESRRPNRLAPETRSTSLGSDSSASSIRRLSPQDSIEEEEYDYEDAASLVWPGSSQPSPLASQPTIHDIPIIKLPDEEPADS